MADKIKDGVKGSEARDDDAILKEAHARFKLCVEAETEIRKLAAEDIAFALGEQWDEALIRARKEDKRPALVINKTGQQVNQITNDQRQNRPAIKVSPVDSMADPETAKIRQGLIRHIEYDSNADIAYANSYELGVMGGFGFWRVLTEYASPTSFKQEAKIKQIKNPFAAYLDPSHKEPDGSDAEYGFVFEDYSEDQYKLLYPKSKLSDAKMWESTGNETPDWMPNKAARVAEYFYKEYTDDTLLLLSDGSEILESKVEAMGGVLPEGRGIVNSRATRIPKVRWVKLNAVELLEKSDFPGQYIPIIPFYGKDIVINGKRVLKGIVRDAKDPARMYNYAASAEAEAIALAPRAPWIVAEGQIEGYEGIWDTANQKNYSYLPYRPTAVNGTVVGPPQRNAFEPAVQAITQARMLASDDLKAATGIYDAALGNSSNENSGVAIQRRTAQSNTANFHFIDNLNRSIRHTGRILNDVITVVYDAEQTARILGEEGDQKVVTLNAPFKDNGKEVKYDMSIGKYDVTIDTGPSFQTKRQEAAAAMLEMSKAVPQIMQVAPDLVIKAMDWPGASEFADRMKKTVPPGIIEEKGDQEIPPQVKGQMDQMGQMLDQMTAKLNELQSEREQKLIELQSRERIEMAKLETQAAIKLAELQSREALSMLQQQIAELDQRQQILGSMEPMQYAEASQDMSPPEAGGELAMAPEMDNQDPTGGVPPGLSMEGIIEP